MKRIDKEMVEVCEGNSAAFVNAVNKYLKMGCWRIVHVEVAVSNNFYLAILVRGL